MGCCLSKKSSTIDPLNPPEKPKSGEQSVVTKEVSGWETREVEKPVTDQGKKADGSAGKNGGLRSNSGTITVPSSCTREEVDAILIECGRLSRSSSTGKATYASENNGSGSRRRRSYDMDCENRNGGDEEELTRERPRRTPSRERDKSRTARPRSSSRERRVSRSPGRRSESPVKNRRGADSSCMFNSRPGKKMVTVPATVSGGYEANAASKRVPVKRSSGASHRAHSSARMQSPYRKHPLTEIDSNVQKQWQTAEGSKEQSGMIPELVGLDVISSGQENLKHHKVAKIRCSRLSRDIDAEVVVTNHNVSSPYTELLLEDIESFHQKNNPANTAAAAFSLPPCVAKACSILEAVANLNSSTDSNEDVRSFTPEHISKIDSKLTTEDPKPEPILESEVIVDNNDSLMEPTYHKYVPARMGSRIQVDLEEQESTDSNNSVKSSIAGRLQGQIARQKEVEGGKGVSAKKRASEQQIGVGRARTGTQGPHMVPAVAAT